MQTRFEAEDASATCDGAIESEHAGFSGSGFCNTENTTGVAAQFEITAEGGTAEITVRYANGGSGDRPADVIVNGSTATTATFADTGAWTNWATETVTVPLNAGDNTVRLEATGSDGLPNVDYLEI
ncbi:carbohydrate-binding protein [Glycomyces xiaoerkulensis]|uniref:carbohydrate-binding protein n=1 Tax=Glycomyces xiaoerkulensis TaxID=2038139 RepID=UPI0038CBF569